MSSENRDRTRSESADHEERPGLADLLRDLDELSQSIESDAEPEAGSRTEAIRTLSAVLPPEALSPGDTADAEARWTAEDSSRPRFGWALLAAAALILVVGGALWFAGQEGPAPAVSLESLVARLPDEASRDSLARVLDLESALDRVEDDLPLQRGGDRDATREPRGAVAEIRPVFRFSVPDRSWTYRIEILEPEGKRRYDGIRTTTDDTVVTFELPSAEPLVPGETYTWRAEVDPRSGLGRRFPLFPSEPLRIVDPMVRDRLLDIEPSGRDAIDRLVRAARLLTVDLGTDAKSELDAIDPDTLSPRESAFRELLLLEARGLRNESVAAEEIDALRERIRQL